MYTCEYFTLTDLDIEKLEGIFPHVDVKDELKKMAGWLWANSNKRYKNYKRFIFNWLNRVKGVTKSTVSDRHYDNIKRKQRREMVENDPEELKRVSAQVQADLKNLGSRFNMDNYI